MNTEPYQTIEKDGCTIAIYSDDNPESPREWDNLGIMVCSHDRYNLGDVQIGYKNSEYYYQDEQAFIDWLEVNRKKIIALPLYLYDHSGITMSTSNRRYPFNDGWDSGCVGFIYITYEKIKEEYGYNVITKKRREQITQYLINEVATYDDYLTGNVFGYEVTCDNCGAELGACWGFYGDNWKENGLLYYAEPECYCKDCHAELESNWLKSAEMLE